MPDTEKPAEPQVEIETARSERFVVLYANNAEIETSVWDFRLTFGELRKAGSKLVAEQSATIIMSPQHAKALAGVLASNVREYEKKVGEIKLPMREEAPQPARQTPLKS